MQGQNKQALVVTKSNNGSKEREICYTQINVKQIQEHLKLVVQSLQDYVGGEVVDEIWESYKTGFETRERVRRKTIKE